MVTLLLFKKTAKQNRQQLWPIVPGNLREVTNQFRNLNEFKRSAYNDCMIQLGTTVFDSSAQMLRDSAGARIALRAQAARVLEYLVHHSGTLVTKDQLVNAVWGNIAVTDDSLVQCIGEIRTAIGDERHEVLQTERRRGYRLVVPASCPAGAVDVTTTLAIPPSTSASMPAPTASNTAHSADGLVTPAIAVMAFTSMDGDERSERLAMAFAGDLITELSKLKSLRVIGRFSSFSLRGQLLDSNQVCEKLNARYLVSGQVQFSETTIVWSLEMIDGQTDEIVWSERKQVKFSDIEQEMATLFFRIAGTLNASLSSFTWRKSFAQAPESLNAYDLCSRAIATMLSTTVESTREAQRLAALAAQAFPRYARAWRTLAHSHSWDIVFCHTGQWTAANAEQALAETYKAIELDPSQTAAHYVASQLLIDLGKHPEALLASAQALALGPSDQSAMQFRSHALFFSGQLNASKTVSESLIALAPIRQSHLLYSYGRTLLALEERQAAISELQECLTASPGNTQARMALVVALEETGQHMAAAEHFKTLLATTNGFDENYFGRRWSAIPEVRERFVNALKKHGMKPAAG
jgi:TolB-like protein